MSVPTAELNSCNEPVASRGACRPGLTGILLAPPATGGEALSDTEPVDGAAATSRTSGEAAFAAAPVQSSPALNHLFRSVGVSRSAACGLMLQVRYGKVLERRDDAETTCTK